MATTHETHTPPLDGTWPLAGRAHRSRWRVLAALGAIGEAAGHIPVTQEHLSEAPYIGVGFVLLTVAGFLLAALLLTADTTAVWSATGAVAALALTGFVLSRTVGLPQIRDDIGSWGEPLGIVCLAAEALMLAAAAAQLFATRAEAVSATGRQYRREP